VKHAKVESKCSSLLLLKCFGISIRMKIFRPGGGVKLGDVFGRVVRSELVELVLPQLVLPGANVIKLFTAVTYAFL
jgi:hypothetical protein